MCVGGTAEGAARTSPKRLHCTAMLGFRSPLLLLLLLLVGRSNRTSTEALVLHGVARGVDSW